MNRIDEVVEMMGILRRLETEDLEKVLKTINIESNLDKYEVKEVLNKKGFEVEVCEECDKLKSLEDTYKVSIDGNPTSICYDCLENNENYALCHGCGSNHKGCYKRVDDLYVVRDKNSSSDEYITHQICDDFIDQYFYCINCGCYFGNAVYEETKGCCPECGIEIN